MFRKIHFLLAERKAWAKIVHGERNEKENVIFLFTNRPFHYSDFWFLIGRNKAHKSLFMLDANTLALFPLKIANGLISKLRNYLSTHLPISEGY